MAYATNMMLIILIAGILGIVSRILITLAVDNDCRANGAKNRVGWSILTFFIPIAAIVYLFLRKNGVAKDVPKMCISCGATNMQEAVVCTNCGNAAFADFEVKDKQQYSKKAKGFLIGGLVSWVVGFVVCLVMMLNVIFGAMESVGGDFKDFIDDYRDEFGYSDHADSDDFGYFDDFDSDENFDDFGELPENPDDFEDFFE